jgi:uncharacterized protein (UPF0335 family)
MQAAHGVLKVLIDKIERVDIESKAVGSQLSVAYF